MSEKSTAAVWRETFARWPAQFRRKGVVLPSYGEPIPFVDFVMNADVIVLERPTPDNAGARRVAIPFQLIEGLKYTEPLKTDQFLNSGFVKGVKQQDQRSVPSAAPAPKAAAPVAIAETTVATEPETPPAG